MSPTPFGGEAGQIDGAAVPSGDDGQRPIDVAAKFGRHRDTFGGDQPLDAALCRGFDPRLRVVENIGRRGRDIRFDVLRPRRTETDAGPRQVQLEPRAAFGAGEVRRQACRAVNGVGEQPGQWREFRNLGAADAPLQHRLDRRKLHCR